MVINRVEGVVGGYVVTPGKLSLERLLLLIRQLVLDPEYQGHYDHEPRTIIHDKGDMGVADPLNMSATVGWKCQKCMSERHEAIVNEENVNPHFKRPAEFGLEVK